MQPKNIDFNFDDLFVLDMANNHQGSLMHGKQIIREHAKIIKRNGVRAGIKFQFRNLPEFVHKNEREASENKHVPRFLSTMLSWDEFKALENEVKQCGLISICTPFDETSVDRIVEIGFDVIKVASCSARDWPLLEKIVDTGLPVIASTGGLSISEIDALVSFFNHRACTFALMHCVSIYPTPDEACNLRNISTFKKRYPEVTIGWSTHELPDEGLHVGLATALGARMQERHIGLETDEIKLNKYSSTPEQCDVWLQAYDKASLILGSYGRENVLEEETAALDSLKRGVFLRNSVEDGELISRSDVYFAFPYREGQVSSSEFRSGGVITQAISGDDPIMLSDFQPVLAPTYHLEQILKSAIHEVKGMLAVAGINLSHEFQTEYSHHYGIENFRKVGAVLITVINRAYAKKIIVLLPGQRHPLHMHKLKEETFIVIDGSMKISLDDREHQLFPGDQLTVPPGVWHRFDAQSGVIFEEISTTAFKDDSYYKDQNVSSLSSQQRKTVVDHWGRFQINEQLESAEITG